MVRIYFVTSEYKVFDRVLGWRKDLAGGPDALVQATMDVIDDFCQPKPPDAPAGPKNVVLRAKILSVIHGADCDGASDEQRCIRVLFQTGRLPMMKRIGDRREARWLFVFDGFW